MPCMNTPRFQAAARTESGSLSLVLVGRQMFTSLGAHSFQHILGVPVSQDFQEGEREGLGIRMDLGTSRLAGESIIVLLVRTSPTSSVLCSRPDYILCTLSGN